jgi:lantibiotic modifying enzyme
VDTRYGTTFETARSVADRLATGAEPPAGTAPAAGEAGAALALLHAYETLGDERYSVTARAFIRRAARAVAGAPTPKLGLFTGMAGLVWALTEFAAREPQYEPPLRTTAGRLAEHAIARDVARERGRTRLSEYDVVSGAAGQFAALVRASRALRGEDDLVNEAVTRLTGYLLRVTEIGEDGVPGWLIPPASYSVPFFRSDFPDGLYNPGMAHGAAGVLAALCAVAEEIPAERPRVERRIADLADWLAWCRLDDAAGPAWPLLLSAAPETRVPVLDPTQEAGRTGWCHGAPGIADALLAAAAVTGRSAHRDLAIAALDRVIHTPEVDRRLTDAGLCHGKAGLLAAFTRAHRWTGAERYARFRDVAAHDLGLFATHDRVFPPANEPRGEAARDRGLLTGSAGVLLALIGVLPPEAGWDDMLFLTTPR